MRRELQHIISVLALFIGTLIQAREPCDVLDLPYIFQMRYILESFPRNPDFS